MLGPAVAGILIATLGSVAWVFLFDALSFIVVILIVRNVQLRQRADSQGPPIGSGIKAILKSMKYFFDDTSKRYKQFQMFLSIAIAVPMLNMVFRSYLKTKFDLSAEQFGYLFSFPAMGAMVGALYLTFAALKKPMTNLYFSIPLLVVALFTLQHANTPFLAASVLGFTGFFSYLNVASITQTIQMETPDHYRGRLGSLLTLGFATLGPLMSFPIGVYADWAGIEVTIRHLTLLFAAGSLWLALLHHRTRHLRQKSSPQL
jgi:MFS family permease